MKTEKQRKAEERDERRGKRRKQKKVRRWERNENGRKPARKNKQKTRGNLLEKRNLAKEPKDRKERQKKLDGKC